MRGWIKGVALAMALWAGLAPASPAQESPPTDLPAAWAALAETPTWQRGGEWSVQLLTGYYQMSGFGQDGVPWVFKPGGVIRIGTRGHYDLAPLTARLGYECPATWFPDTLLQGRFQLLAEYMAAPVTRGFGHVATGPSLLLRYNYRRDDCPLVPYIQGGGGLLFNDAYHADEQHLVGGPVEYLLQALVGVHYYLSPRCSLDAEGGYIHVSNADMYSRNVGVNSFGGSVGVTFYLGRGAD